MSKRIFTKEQIEQLLKNPNIEGCSEKSISYKKEFKVSSVRKHREGAPPSWIFKEADFNLVLIGYDTPKWCLKRWLKIYREKGEDGLKTDGRKGNNPNGRPKGIRHLSDKEKLKYLEAEVAYLKAENSFLAKLRKKS